MTKARCPLVWKAAALEDGRLDGVDSTSFEDHATRCADCSAERSALAALARELRKLPSSELAPLERARQRGALLARANERFVAPRRSRAPLIALAVVGALTIMGVIGARYVHRERSLGLASSAAEAGATMEPPRYEVVASEHAIWRAKSDGPVIHVDVADGKATFEVDPLDERQRFLIALPDGDAEVTGARFSVDVALGSTRSVNVSRGRLVFRRRHQTELTLNAGESWQRNEPAPQPDTNESPTRGAIAPRATMSSAPRPPLPPVHGQASASPSAQNARTQASAVTSLAAAKFGEAIGSFVRGAYAQADVELRDFAAEFPGDARCEDAAFLSAVARWRLGDVPGARARAERYLESYPNGLRRSEAQQILTTP